MKCLYCLFAVKREGDGAIGEGEGRRIAKFQRNDRNGLLYNGTLFLQGIHTHVIKCFRLVCRQAHCIVFGFHVNRLTFCFPILE